MKTKKEKVWLIKNARKIAQKILEGEKEILVEVKNQDVAAICDELIKLPEVEHVVTEDECHIRLYFR